MGLGAPRCRAAFGREGMGGDGDGEGMEMGRDEGDGEGMGMEGRADRSVPALRARPRDARGGQRRSGSARGARVGFVSFGGKNEFPEMRDARIWAPL